MMLVVLFIGRSTLLPLRFLRRTIILKKDIAVFQLFNLLLECEDSSVDIVSTGGIIIKGRSAVTTACVFKCTMEKD